jgi:NACHT domain
MDSGTDDSSQPPVPQPPQPQATQIHGDLIEGNQVNINTGGGAYIEKLVVNAVPQAPTWAEVSNSSRQQTDRFFNSQRSFLPDLYVPRGAVEAALAAFLAGPKAACILLGPAGSGKTTLLSHWAQALLGDGHAVFIYDCGGSLGLEVEQEAAKDLLLDPDLEIFRALRTIAQEAATAGRQFVLIFDALNEFRGSGQEGADALLKRLDSLASRLPDSNVRLVFSCNTTTWDYLDRNDATQLAWGRYYPASQQMLKLDLFTPDELAAAYTRYQAHFHLHSPLAEVPPALREQLRSPLVLDLLAEAYQDRDEPITHEALALGVFQRYFDERVKSLADQRFVDELAAEMLRQKRSSLRLNDLLANPRLEGDILNPGLDSSYRALLDKGILTTTTSGLGRSETVKFTYAQVGAYALARSLAGSLEPDADVAALITGTLLADARSFPLGWGTARTLVTLYALDDPEHKTVAALAQSANAELRELVVQALVQLYADVPQAAVSLIGELLQKDSAEARRTALNAAYRIGPAARPIFLAAIAKGPPELRPVLRDALYLIGADDPEFMFCVLDDLASAMSLTSPVDFVNSLSFILDLSITFYINHCDLDITTQRTSDLFYQLLKVRLHADVLDLPVLGSALQPLLVQVVARGYSSRLVDMLAELVPADQQFNLAPEDQARFKRLVPFVDPQTDLGPLADDLAAFLQSGVLLFNLLAAVVLVAHAYHDFAETEPLLRRLFDGLAPGGQLMELVAFSLLLPASPTGWVGLLEDFTRRLFEQQPDLVYGHTPSLLAKLDLLLMPLGLAYAKRGQGMPLVVDLLRAGLAQTDRRQVERCLAALGPVGFYHPQAVLAALRDAGLKLDDAALQSAIVRCLATVRLLHGDEVDLFLSQAGAEESLQQQVSTAADVELVRRFIYGLGIYNTTVHQALNYPRMRRQLLIGSLTALSDARNAQDFIARYSPVPIHMLREAGYRLSEWTLPE